MFGSGGELVEVYRDRALALPPLNSTLAHRLLEQTRIFKALSGVRGRRAVDIAALEALLVRFSRLIVENPAIKEAASIPWSLPPIRSSLLMPALFCTTRTSLPVTFPSLPSDPTQCNMFRFGQ